VHQGKKRVRPEVGATLAEHMADESLTSREVEVPTPVAGGNRNRDIAENLRISEETVKIHIMHIMEKRGRRTAHRRSPSRCGRESFSFESFSQ